MPLADRRVYKRLRFALSRAFSNEGYVLWKRHGVAFPAEGFAEQDPACAGSRTRQPRWLRYVGRLEKLRTHVHRAAGAFEPFR